MGFMKQKKPCTLGHITVSVPEHLRCHKRTSVDSVKEWLGKNKEGGRNDMLYQKEPKKKGHTPMVAATWGIEM